MSVWYKTWFYWEMHRTSPNSCYTKTGVLIETLISSQHNVGATSEVLRNVTWTCLLFFSKNLFLETILKKKSKNSAFCSWYQPFSGSAPVSSACKYFSWLSIWKRPAGYEQKRYPLLFQTRGLIIFTPERKLYHVPVHSFNLTKKARNGSTAPGPPPSHHKDIDWQLLQNL